MSSSQRFDLAPFKASKRRAVPALSLLALSRSLTVLLLLWQAKWVAKGFKRGNRSELCLPPFSRTRCTPIIAIAHPNCSMGLGAVCSPVTPPPGLSPACEQQNKEGLLRRQLASEQMRLFSSDLMSSLPSSDVTRVH